MIAVFIGAEPRFGRRKGQLDHLKACGLCARRYQDFIGQLTDERDDANAEADAVFTPARLETQRLQIMQRLEHATQPARVIPFPTTAAANMSIFTGRQVRRWIAAAAAAGLFIGLTLGRMSDFRPAPLDNGARVVPAPVVQPRQAVQPIAAQQKATEEELFSRAEQAQSELQVPAELEALSAITPMREVALRLPSGR